MGKSSSYSDDLYTSHVTSAVRSGRVDDLFDYNKQVKSGAAPLEPHAMMNPAGLNKAGQKVREALDSADYPESLPIVVLLDITGSMRDTPKQMVAGLGKLMRLLVQKGYAQFPQICFGFFGDWKTDQVPLQIGYFEADNTIESSLTLAIIDCCDGGGNRSENSEAALWFMASHSSLDSLRKRGQRGKLFVISDEKPYPTLRPEFVARFIGEQTETMSFEDVLKLAEQSYEVWWVGPRGTQYEDTPEIINHMRGLFAENYLRLDDANHIAELIAATVAISEGFDPEQVYADLSDVGADLAGVKSASKALAVYAHKSGGLQRATVEGDLAVATGPAAVERIKRNR